VKSASIPTLTRRRPRSFVEWRTLRDWDKLPKREASVPGYLLRVAREEAGLTQAELARSLGVTQQAVAQAERWESNPTIGFVERWAAACNRRLEIRLPAA
jgi:DNA-binding XRE family transcriptional regulator